MTQKISETEKKIHDHNHSNKYITAKKFNKFTTEKFTDDFVEKADFDDKLKNVNKKSTSNQAKHLEAEKELIDLTN